MPQDPIPPNKPKPIPIKTPPDLAVEYANLVRIAHSPSEIVFEFAQLLPGSPSAQVQSRIVMTPIGAKLFARALHENLSKFETTFGEISVPGGSSLADYLFRPPDPPT
jgi:hypothetical protein